MGAGELLMDVLGAPLDLEATGQNAIFGQSLYRWKRASPAKCR